MAYATTLTDIDRGDLLVATASFANAAGTATDPDTIVWTVRAPNGSETTYTHGTDSESAKTATGVYTLTFAVDAAGQWDVRAAGTGAVEQTVIGKIVVDRDRFSS